MKSFSLSPRGKKLHERRSVPLNKSKIFHTNSSFYENMNIPFVRVRKFDLSRYISQHKMSFKTIGQIIVKFRQSYIKLENISSIKHVKRVKDDTDEDDHSENMKLMLNLQKKIHVRSSKMLDSKEYNIEKIRKSKDFLKMCQMIEKNANLE